MIEDNIRRVEEKLSLKAKEIIDDINVRLLGYQTISFDDMYFAGGCIYSLWNNQIPKDYDIFLRNKDTVELIKNIFTSHKWGCTVSEYAITYQEFQFVTKYYGEPDDVVGEFDFKHTMYWWDDKNGLRAHKSLLDKLESEQWQYLDSNKLQYNFLRARDILNSLTRIPKFIRRGMTISQAEMLGMIRAGIGQNVIEKERDYINTKIDKMANGKLVEYM